jgi:hypothetical protein
VAAVIKSTAAAFRAGATYFRSRTMDMSRSLIAAEAFAERKLSANASCKAQHCVTKSSAFLPNLIK